MSKIKLFICWLALKFRWKSEVYAKWYSEETEKLIRKAIAEMDIDTKDITFK